MIVGSPAFSTEAVEALPVAPPYSSRLLPTKFTNILDSMCHSSNVACHPRVNESLVNQDSHCSDCDENNLNVSLENEVFNVVDAIIDNPVQVTNMSPDYDTSTNTHFLMMHSPTTPILLLMIFGRNI
jgi:hypothetical protein